MQKQTYQPLENPITGAFTESARTLQQIESVSIAASMPPLYLEATPRLDDESELIPVRHQRVW